MREIARRSWAAGVAAVALAAGLTACSGGSDEGGDGDSKASASQAATVSPASGKQACADGTYTWSGVRETKRLTGVSEPERVGKGGGTLTERPARVYTPRQSVEAHGSALSSAEVLFSLGRKAGVIESDADTLADEDGTTYTFTDVNAKAPELNDSGSYKVDGAGRFIQYAYTVEVAGDFRYDCADGTDVLGHAVGWKVDGFGLLDCDAAIGGGDEKLARNAARLGCEAGAEAVRGS